MKETEPCAYDMYEGIRDELQQLDTLILSITNSSPGDPVLVETVRQAVRDKAELKMAYWDQRLPTKKLPESPLVGIERMQQEQYGIPVTVTMRQEEWAELVAAVESKYKAVSAGHYDGDATEKAENPQWLVDLAGAHAKLTKALDEKGVEY